mgnify:CR=1 FL=1
MIQVYLNTSEFNKISELLPDICPEVKFTLKAQDDNLVKIGLAESAPCIIEFDTSVEDFYDMLDTLNDIEIDAFNTNDIEPSERNTDYQKYLKFGCLYDILYTAKRTYPTIGKVKYVGKSFGVDSLTDGKIRLTKNSHAIHHFAATWVSTKNRFKTKILEKSIKIIKTLDK